MLFFLISFDWVQFAKDNWIQEEDKQHAIKVASRQYDKEADDHVDCGPCTLVEVGVEFWAWFCKGVGGVGGLGEGFGLLCLFELCWGGLLLWVHW